MRFFHGPTMNSEAMGWDPAMHGPGHTFHWPCSHWPSSPSKADYLTERTAGFLIFSYPCATPSDIWIVRQRHGHENLRPIERYIAIVENEEVRVREWAAPA